MKPWKVLASAPAPDGGDFVLSQRDGEFVLRVKGAELMSSRRHGSEEAMASVVAAELARPKAHVLVGGLGFGFTARAVLDRLGPEGHVTVAEISPAIVDWNRIFVGELANHPLNDPRVTVICSDVGKVLAKAAQAEDTQFDAVLMDVDNGPWALSAPKNQRLWQRTGIETIARVLRSDGALVVWSTNDDPIFVSRLKASGFSVERRPARSQGEKGDRHLLFLARPQPIRWQA
jgi:spermidine synthase